MVLCQAQYKLNLAAVFGADPIISPCGFELGGSSSARTSSELVEAGGRQEGSKDRERLHVTAA